MYQERMFIMLTITAVLKADTSNVTIYKREKQSGVDYNRLVKGVPRFWNNLPGIYYFSNNYVVLVILIKVVLKRGLGPDS